MKKSKFGEFKKQLALQSMVLPGLIFMAIFCYWPIYGLTVAFQHYTVVDTIDTAPWIGLENFLIAFKDRFFWDSVKNTLAISSLKLLICFPLPIAIAILITEMKDGGYKKLVQTVSYLPHFLSWIVLGGMIINWLSTTGMVSQVLMFFGFIKEPTNYLVQADKYWFIAVLSEAWKETGWNTIIYIAVITSIDTSYYEAARIDGASKLKQIIHITLPLMKQIVTLNLILTIGGLLNSNLDQTMVLLNPLNRPRAEVINSYVFNIGITQGSFSYATAVGLSISVVSLILVLITNAITRKLNDNQSVF